MCQIRNTRLQFVGVGILLTFVFLVTIYFYSGNKGKPKTGAGPFVHEGPPLTGVYLNFDTSKYTDLKGRIFIPDDSVLSKMPLAELEELYHRYQETLQFGCPLQLHVGDEFVGGYHICEPFVKKNDCLAYIFGSRREFSFGDGLVSLFGCKVHSFIPSDGDDDGKHSGGVVFHKMGLAGRDETIKEDLTDHAVLHTLGSIRKELGQQNDKIDIMQIDIDGREWLALRHMLDSKSLEKSQTKTLIVTFNIVNERRDVGSYLYMLRILRELHELGYRRFMFRMWWKTCTFIDRTTKLERTGCHEAHFILSP